MGMADIAEVLQYYDKAQSAHALAKLYETGASADRQAADFPLGLNDSFALTQYDWLQAIRTRAEPQTSGAEGLRDLACAFAILESDLAGQRIAVEDVLTGAVAAYQQPLNEHFSIPLG